MSQMFLHEIRVKDVGLRTILNDLNALIKSPDFGWSDDIVEEMEIIDDEYIYIDAGISFEDAIIELSAKHNCSIELRLQYELEYVDTYVFTNGEQTGYVGFDFEMDDGDIELDE